jgi:hypothetical protein
MEKSQGGAPGSVEPRKAEDACELKYSMGKFEGTAAEPMKEDQVQIEVQNEAWYQGKKTVQAVSEPG